MIDMQRDFLDPGGFGAALGNDVSQLRPARAPARQLLAGWRAAGLPVIHTREAHAPDLSDCPESKRLRTPEGLRIGDTGPMGRILIRGEPGCEIVPDLAPQSDELVVDKPGKGAFYATGLDAELRGRGITHLVIAGVTTEVCVQTSMREATDRGFTCLLAADATASYVPHFHQAVLEMVTSQGAIVGWTAPVGSLLKTLRSVDV
jgi:nicotinamidase-related amidase